MDLRPKLLHFNKLSPMWIVLETASNTIHMVESLQMVPPPPTPPKLEFVLNITPLVLYLFSCPFLQASFCWNF